MSQIHVSWAADPSTMFYVGRVGEGPYAVDVASETFRLWSRAFLNKVRASTVKATNENSVLFVIEQCEARERANPSG